MSTGTRPQSDPGESLSLFSFPSTGCLPDGRTAPPTIGREECLVIVRILREAEEELYQAAVWYEDREHGVGLRLLSAYNEARRCIARTCGLRGSA